jgi:hypothetical protein
MNGLLDSQEDDLSPPQSFYGKYRATVLNNVDPMFQGRIQVLVPDVSDFLPTTWAMCPYRLEANGILISAAYYLRGLDRVRAG